jgi:shikimate kinase
MAKPKRIIIVGHMGAGKSLLAKALADKLGW